MKNIEIKEITAQHMPIVDENPAFNATTLKALQEAEKGNLKRFDTVSKLMKDLKK